MADESRHNPGVERIYANDQIEVWWEPGLCIHHRACVRGLPAVFDPRRRPWVDVDAGSADDIAAVIERCPSGALHYRRRDGSRQEVGPATTIQPQLDGPLFVRGDIVVADDQGRVIRHDTRLALCRCGQSANKPFCDGSHERVGFRSS